MRWELGTAGRGQDQRSRLSQNTHSHTEKADTTKKYENITVKNNFKKNGIIQ